MLKKILFALSFISCGVVLADTANPPLTPNMPLYIDYSLYQTSIHTYGVYEQRSWKVGYSAFNYAPEISPVFLKLKKDYKIDTAVETGTFLGGTTVFFSLLFDEVHTIEVDDETFQTSKTRLQEFSNVHCHLGSSEAVFPKILANLQDKRVLFYLDAHWGSYWPLLDEIEQIGKTHKDNCIIVIDDFKVPGRADIPYDSYGRHECSYEYIKDQLDKAFTEHTVFYIVPRSVLSRAKLVVLPKKWKEIKSEEITSKRNEVDKDQSEE